MKNPVPVYLVTRDDGRRAVFSDYEAAEDWRGWGGKREVFIVDEPELDDGGIVRRLGSSMRNLLGKLNR